MAGISRITRSYLNSERRNAATVQAGTNWFTVPLRVPAGSKLRLVNVQNATKMVEMTASIIAMDEPAPDNNNLALFHKEWMRAAARDVGWEGSIPIDGNQAIFVQAEDCGAGDTLTAVVGVEIDE